MASAIYRHYSQISRYTTLNTSLIGPIVAVAMIVFIHCFCEAKSLPDTARVFISLIERYDISSPALRDSSSKPSDFWKHIANKNKYLHELRHDIEKRTAPANRALESFRRLPSCSRDMIISTDDTLQPRIDSIFDASGFDRRLCEPIVVDHPWCSAIVARRHRGGFVMLINSGLVAQCDISASEDSARLFLKAILAREFSRALLSQHLRQFFSIEKKVQRLRLWTSLASLILPTSTSRAYDYSGFIRSYSDPANDRDFVENFDAEAANFYFPFDNEYDIEADIVAYRFMEWLGHADIYIECLRKLNMADSYPEFYPLDTISDGVRLRIALLEFMRDNPDLKAYRRKQHLDSRRRDPIYD